MKNTHFRIITVWISFILFSLPSFAAQSKPIKSQVTSFGHLTVFIVFDQMRLKEISKYEHLFGEGGFGGLMNENTEFRAAEYQYFTTETGPGHATISTGLYPNVHGIPANSWPLKNRMQYVVEDVEAPILYKKEHPFNGRSPRNLKAESLSDYIKNAGQGNNKVYSVAIKDRAAILLGGHQPDLALWYDKKLGAFTSSQYYTAEIEEWLKALTFGLPKKSMENGTWKKPVISNHAGILIPKDSRKGESEYYSWSKSFPHNLRDLKKEKHKKSLYRASPQALSDIFQISKSIIKKKNLGKEDSSDIIFIGASVTDYIGHAYGPDSLEYLAILIAADKELRKLVTFLKKDYLSEHFTLCLTADHGAPDLPDQIDGPLRQGRIDGPKMQKSIDTLLSKIARPQSKAFLKPPHIYFKLAEADQVNYQSIIKNVQKRVEQNPHIVKVHNISEKNTNNPLKEFLKNSLYEKRSGELILEQEEFYVFDWGSHSGIDHGSVNSYDRIVPFYLMDSRITKGKNPSPIQVTDIKDIILDLNYR